MAGSRTSEAGPRAATPAAPGRHAGNVSLEGGRLCLDFVNTMDWRGRAKPEELLRTPGDLLAWSVHVGLLDGAAASRLAARAVAHPLPAGAALDAARALREALHGLFRAAAEGRFPVAAQAAVLNTALTQPITGWRVLPGAGGWRWEGDDWAGLLWPVAASAAELLASPALARVRPCADADCGWLFLDTSRSGRRRWCSMAGCGNRAKARRHYRRARGRGSAVDLAAPVR